MATVTLDKDAFREAFPAFTDTTDSQLDFQWGVATLLIDNTDASIVPYDPDNGETARQTILWLALAHLAELAGWSSGQTGPVASASQGSVSTSFSAVQGSDEWWGATKYGQMVKRLLLPYTLGGRLYKGSTYHPWG